MRKVVTSEASRILLALSLLVPSACDARVEAPPSSPSIAIVDPAGLEAALEAARGQGLLLNVWAMWCAPCVAELPELVEVARAWRERGGRVVGVSYDLMVAGSDADTIVDEVRGFLARRELDLDVLIYDAPDFDAINERFALPGEIPVTLAIDATGRIVDRQEGRAGKARFEEMMRAAMGR